MSEIQEFQHALLELTIEIGAVRQRCEDSAKEKENLRAQVARLTAALAEATAHAEAAPFTTREVEAHIDHLDQYELVGCRTRNMLVAYAALLRQRESRTP
jgi:regulator of replication initiation timing